MAYTPETRCRFSNRFIRPPGRVQNPPVRPDRNEVTAFLMKSGSEFKGELTIIAGTVGIAGAIFWMGVYLLGPLTLIPGAFAFLGMLWHYRSRINTFQELGQQVSGSLLLAAQTSLLIATAYEILPLVFRHV